MPTSFFRRFANPETLRRVSEPYLLALLSADATQGYLISRGFTFPSARSGALDHEALAAILLNPDAEMPNALVDDLYLMDEMATEPIMLELLDAVPPGLVESGEADPTPADVVLQLLLKDRKLLERKRAEQFLHRSRSFRVCQGNGTQKELPRCTESTEGLVPLTLGEWFFGHRRGRKCRVSFFSRPAEGQLWILVQRGAAMRIQGTFDEGQSSSLLFRPQAFDLIVYYLEQDVLVVHTDTDTKGELELYRKTIGKYLFEDEDYFAATGNYTLTPLMKRGRAALDCDGVSGIESVDQGELEIYRGTGTPMFIRLKGDDVFASLEESHMSLPKGLPTKAVFRVKFTESEKPRAVTIRPPSRDRYERDDDRAVMEPFFKRNGFIQATRGRADAAA